jgi:uncharacterized pyridoxal phosphate-containing UPF0001 family protein
MGMPNDYYRGLEEGSMMVRVHMALGGARRA